MKTADKYLKLVQMIKTKNLLDVISKIKKDKEKNTKIKKILTLILSRKIFANDKAGLENCFNKWRRLNQLAKNNATKIANAKIMQQKLQMLIELIKQKKRKID